MEVFVKKAKGVRPRGEPRLELGVHVFEIMSISLDNALSSNVFYGSGSRCTRY